jgi:KDO2-lipid IV(A) lauroyltransferase
MPALTSFRHVLEYGVVLAVRQLVALLPAGGSRSLGTMIGFAFYAIDGRHRRLAVAQLSAAFPVRSEDECRYVARRTFIHFGQAVVGLLRTSTLSAAEILDGIEFEGEDRIRTALSAGKGVIVVAGHFGYWELLALGQAAGLTRMSVLARPLDNPFLHLLLERIRSSTGNQVIYRQRAMRRVLRALENNECVGIMIDQHIQGRDAVPVEFFGRPAATTAAVATLALRTGAAVVPAFAVPLEDGRCRIIYEHPIVLPPTVSGDRVLELTQRCSDVLEMYVRRYPHLWLWMHRRWRDETTGGVPDTGMFPAGARDDGEVTP